MKLQINPTADITGTSLMGHIQATPKQLEAAFGEPEVNHPEDRVPLMWTLVDYNSDQTQAVATVYLWKRNVPGADEVVSWNIGGRDRQAVEWVHDNFRTALGLSARANASQE